MDLEKQKERCQPTCCPAGSGPWISTRGLLGLGAGTKKQVEGGREGGVEDTWELQEMGMQRDRKGCQKSSAAELGMRLRDWIWGK